jgi:hypothetical protein
LWAWKLLASANSPTMVYHLCVEVTEYDDVSVSMFLEDSINVVEDVIRHTKTVSSWRMVDNTNKMWDIWRGITGFRRSNHSDSKSVRVE